MVLSFISFQLRKLRIVMDDSVKENIRLVAEAGCELCEILEWPKLLHLRSELLRKHIDYLKKRNIPVSVGCLRCVNSTRTRAPFKRRLEEYHMTTLGNVFFVYIVHRIFLDKRHRYHFMLLKNTRYLNTGMNN